MIGSLVQSCVLSTLLLITHFVLHPLLSYATFKVLHMDQSPDGGCVVSAAADETLRFWDVFGSPPSERKGNNLAMWNFCGSSMIR